MINLINVHLFLTAILLKLSFEDEEYLVIPITYDFTTSIVSFSAEIGTPQKTKFFYLDLSKDINIIYANYGYNQDESMTMEVYRNEAMLIDNNKAYLATDYAVFGSFIDRRLNFAFIEEKIYPKKGITSYIGLSRANTSFINLLYLDGVITQKSFSFTSNKLFIGEVDPQVHNDFDPNIHKCHTINNMNHWTCSFKGIVIGPKLNTSLNNQETIDLDLNQDGFLIGEEGQLAQFETFSNDIIAPYSAMSFFIDHYLGETLFNWKCWKNTTADEDISIECHSEQRPTLPDLGIIIENVLLVLKDHDLFTVSNPIDDREAFRIVFRKNSKHWILGAGFVKKFHLIFNDDEDYVGFVKSKGAYLLRSNVIKGVSSNKLKAVSAVIFILIGVLIIGIGFTIIGRMKEYNN